MARSRSSAIWRATTTSSASGGREGAGDEVEGAELLGPVEVGADDEDHVVTGGGGGDAAVARSVAPSSGR